MIFFLLGKCNILLIGAGDCRHILKTIAHTYRHERRELCVSLMISSMFWSQRDYISLSACNFIRNLTFVLAFQAWKSFEVQHPNLFLYQLFTQQICVVENNLEIYARHLLLLSIALEPKERLGLQGELWITILLQYTVACSEPLAVVIT